MGGRPDGELVAAGCAALVALVLTVAVTVPLAIVLWRWAL